MNKTILILLAYSFCLPASAQDPPNFWPNQIRGMRNSSLHSPEQTANTGSYFPLATGNMWFYRITDLAPWDPGSPHYIRVYDSLPGNQYPRWVMDSQRAFPTIFDPIDTVTLNHGDTLVWHRQGRDEIIYKFNTTVGDSWSYPVWIGDTTEGRIVHYLGEFDSLRLPRGPLAGRWFRNVKVFFSDVPGYFDVWEYSAFAPGIGLIHRQWYPLTQILYGAVIDGRLYGDTSVVSVPETENEFLPTQLYQNFPNPFNAETSILYSLSVFEFVSLKVFDVLGRQVANLVNEHKLPGVYVARWSANNYPSGVYFYELRVGSQIQKKKMILLH